MSEPRRPQRPRRATLRGVATRGAHYPSRGEELLLLHLCAEGVAEPIREYRFAKSLARQWRFDLAWPGLMLAVEVEGGTRAAGRHNRRDGYEADCTKYNAAVILGWRVLRYTTRQVESGEAARQIIAVLAADKSQR